MRLRVLHTTRYGYQTPVVQAQHQAHLRPLDLPGQTVLAHRLSVSPQPTHAHTRTDAFGNWRVFFVLQEPHDTLTVEADSEVATAPPSPVADTHLDTWETVREQVLYRARAPYVPASGFVFASPYVPRDDTFADLARPLFTPGRPLFHACADLMGQLHRDLVYETASTAINTPALEALAQGKGVCQDFAHIMIGCLRSLGLPARYVSGYLLTQPPPGQPRLLGVDASHAWLAVWCPQHDWVELDPTNNLIAAQSHAVIACGRDYADVAPRRGVIQGGGSHTLSVAVSVAPEGEHAVGTPS